MSRLRATCAAGSLPTRRRTSKASSSLSLSLSLTLSLSLSLTLSLTLTETAAHDVQGKPACIESEARAPAQPKSTTCSP